MSRQRRNYARAAARVARVSNARFVLTFLALIAFTCQTYITQTHIHFRLASDNVAATTDKAAPVEKKGGKDPFRSDQDPVNCPICQELVHAGPVIVPAAIVVPSALPIFNLVAVAETARHFQAPSHNWQGRAPPPA